MASQKGAKKNFSRRDFIRTTAVGAAAVGRWNAFCEAGEDKDFGRRGKALVKIATPPYYAIRYWPGGFSTTQGTQAHSKYPRHF